MDNIAYLIPVAGAVALLFTFIKSKAVDKADPGSERMKRIAGNITDGAMAFLRAEYRILLMVVIAVAVLLAAFYSDTRLIALSFVVGAVCSALAGFIGMKVATKANVRTANAAQKGLAQALSVAFSGGAVMGLGVVGLGALGLGSLFYSIKPNMAMTLEKF